jgi:3'-5' exoribonuclease
MYPKDAKLVAQCKVYSMFLRDMARKLCVEDVYDELIHQYPQFEYWSASHNSLLHHYGRGGLVRHTWEIVDLCMTVSITLNLGDKVSPIELYLAALFHDTGKMFDYELVEDDKGTYGDPQPEYWKPNDHRRLIYHVPRSALIWHDVIRKFPELEAKYHDLVLHDILAHHGKREFGSPVAPKTRAAYLIHLCDSLSARMDDCERIDAVKNPDHTKV